MDDGVVDRLRTFEKPLDVGSWLGHSYQQIVAERIVGAC
jgi:hypothetical protein